MNQQRQKQRRTAEPAQVAQATSDTIVDPLSSHDVQSFEPTRKTFEGGQKASPSPVADGLRGIILRSGKKEPPETVKGTSEDHRLPASAAKGSATIVTAVPDNKAALDDKSLTQTYLKKRKESPNSSENQLWERAVFDDANDGGDTLSIHGASSQTKANATKRALVIGNSDYANISDLPGAKRDAQSMAGAYKGDHVVTHKEDLKNSEMMAEINTAQKDLTAGDELVIYYAGHGVSEGLVGVDYSRSAPKTMGYGVLSKAASAAIAGGWHTTIVADACETGALNQQVKDDLSADIGKAIASTTITVKGE